MIYPAQHSTEDIADRSTTPIVEVGGIVLAQRDRV